MIHYDRIPALALLALSAYAQPPAFQFEALIKSGVTVGSHTFNAYSSVTAVALNDSGEVAFAAQYSDHPSPDNAGVFTSKRVVARQGDAVGGKYLVLIPTDTRIAINAAGQVAYEAWYADTREIANAGEASGLGIFVDNRLAMSPAPDSSATLPAFTLGDDGQVTLANAPQAVNGPQSQTPKTPGLLSRVRIKPPAGFPVGIAPSPNKSNRPPLHDPSQPVIGHTASTAFPTNRLGQILVPVNLKEGGFLLLLGTPVSR